MENLATLMERAESTITPYSDGPRPPSTGTVYLDKNSVPNATINELGAAEKYLEVRDLLVEEETGKIFAYDATKGLWERLTDERLEGDIRDFLRYGSPEFEPLNTRSKQRNIRSQVKTLVQESTPFEKSHEFKTSHEWIHVANGMLEVTADGIEIRDFDKNFRSRNRTEINWNPDAECPMFLDKLLRPALSEEDISVLQRYMGQCLLGRNLSQTILIICGNSGTGKSTVGNILQNILGKDNVTELRVSSLGNRFEIGQYMGFTLLTGTDVPGDFLDQPSAGRLKALVGNDALKCEFKGLNAIQEVIGNFNVMIITNTQLKVTLDSDKDAWRRRLILVEFNGNPPTKKIHNFDNKLMEQEAEGILRWAVEGAQKLTAEFEEGNLFQLTENQQRKVDDLLDQSDSLRLFVSRCLEYSPDSNVTTDELTQAYATFCRERNWARFPDKKIQQEIPELMLSYFSEPKAKDIPRNGRNKRGYRHVKIADQ